MAIRQQVKGVLRVALDGVSGMAAMLPRARKARILNYHEVLDGAASCPNPYNQVSARTLELHLELIRAAGFDVVPVTEQARRLRQGAAGASRLISLSFDDGLVEHHDIVLSLLRKHGMTATFYIVSARMGRPAAMGRHGAQHLTADQVGALHRAGMEIGSHSRSHRVLSRLDDRELVPEIVGSREDLAAITGTPPVSFAYPYGTRATYDTRVVDTVRRAGYESAVCTGIGGNDPRTPAYELLRIPVYGTDNGRRLLARARGGYDWTGRAQEAWLKLFPHHSTHAGDD